MAIFNDPGVYVVRRSTPVAAIPVVPAQPAAFIGPMYQIVDNLDAETGVTIDGLLLQSSEGGGAENVSVPYPTLASEDVVVDTDSVKVIVRRPDGREFDITEVCVVSSTAVTLAYEDDDPEGFQEILAEINDAWGGDSAADNFAGVHGAMVFIEYRAHRADLVGQVLKAQGRDGVLSTVGKGVPENPLGLAGLIATAVNGTGMYFVPTPETLTSQNVGDALDLLEPIQAYAPVLLSDSASLQGLVTNHVNNMSSDTERMFRVAWTYYEVPDREALEADETNTITSSSSLSQVKDAQEALIKAYCQSVFNDRTIVIFDDFTAEVDGEVVSLKGYYLCALYAALKSQVAPQQGMTNYPVPGVVKRLRFGSDYFRPSSMVALSEAGAFVLTQAVENGPISCRWQRTTNVLDVRKSEPSFIYSVDRYVATQIATMKRRIGINNVTDETVNQVKLDMGGIHRSFRESGMIRSAQIIDIAPDPDVPTRIRAKERVEFVLPFNTLVITLEY